MKSFLNFSLKRNVKKFSFFPKPITYLKEKYRIWQFQKNYQKKEINKKYLTQDSKTVLKKFTEFSEKSKFLNQTEKELKIREIIKLSYNITDLEDLGISKKWIENLITNIFENENLKEDQNFIIESFWFSHNKITDEKKRNEILSDFLDFFLKSENNWKNKVSILCQIYLNLWKFEKIEDFENKKNFLLKNYADFFLNEIKENDIDYFLVIETIKIFDKFLYKDEGFFFTLESYLTENLLPFRANKVLLVLEYFLMLEKNEKNNKKKLFYFNSMIKLIESNLKYCSFNDLFVILKMYMKISFVFDKDFKKFLISILNSIEKSSGFKEKENLENIKEVCIIAKEIQNKEEFSEFFKNFENLVYKNLETIEPNFFIEFLFLCFEINTISEFYKQKFFEKAINEINLISLENLKKLNWANHYLKGPSLITEKTKKIISAHLDEILKKKDKKEKIDHKIIFPFIWIINTNFEKEIILKYEKIIQNFIKTYNFKEIALIYWSIIQKTIITKKTFYLILERYFFLMENINKKLANLENTDETYFLNEISTWDLTTILWAINNFDFKENLFLFEEILFVSKNIVSFYLEEMSDEEILGIVKVYFSFFQGFENFFENEKIFFDYFIDVLESRAEIFKEDDLMAVVYVISENPILKKNYAEKITNMIKKLKNL